MAKHDSRREGNPLTVKTLTFIAVATAALVTLAGCKSHSSVNPVEPGSEDSTLEAAAPFKQLTINDFQVSLDESGRLTDGQCLLNGSNVGVIFLAGLWIGMEQDGTPRGDIIEDGTFAESNFTANVNGRQTGVFLVDAATAPGLLDWPADLGAPTNGSGDAEYYGDQMCWTGLTSDSSAPLDGNSMPTQLLSQPVHNLRVAEAVFGYSQSGLRNVIFIRYVVTNAGSTPWTGVYIGFYSDTDLDPYWENRTGLDLSRSLSYTYVDSINSTTYSRATGFTFLETGAATGISSSRMMRKYIDPDFRENTFTEPYQILYVLKGLSNSGNPMINPVTGQQTPYAFTGNPVTGTGWLDVPCDVRSIMALGPISFEPNESQVFTLAWVTVDGANLAEAIGNLDNEVDSVRARTSLWKLR